MQTIPVTHCSTLVEMRKAACPVAARNKEAVSCEPQAAIGMPRDAIICVPASCGVFVGHGAKPRRRVFL